MSLSEDEEQILPGPPYCDLCGCLITRKYVICQSCRNKINCSCYDTPGTCDGKGRHTCICEEQPEECKAARHSCICTNIHFNHKYNLYYEDYDDSICKASSHSSCSETDSSDDEDDDCEDYESESDSDYESDY